MSDSIRIVSICVPRCSMLVAPLFHDCSVVPRSRFVNKWRFVNAVLTSTGHPYRNPAKSELGSTLADPERCRNAVGQVRSVQTGHNASEDVHRVMRS
jgi:hypothetical protein